MPRARKGAARTQARRKLLREARGFFGTKSRHKQQAKVAMMRAKRYAWRDRRARKRDFRALWITRITAACRMRGTRYSLFINGLQRAGRPAQPQDALDDRDRGSQDLRRAGRGCAEERDRSSCGRLI
jgi:large subunit ribosomal protein L20